MTKTTRTIGTITITSSSIRTIGAVVKICRRSNGNHSRMTRDANNRSKCILKCTAFSKIQRSFYTAFQKMRSKMAQQTRESGDEALAPVYGIQKVAKPINKNNKINPQTHTSLCIVFFFKKRIAQSIDYLWDFTLCFTGLPPKNVASRGPNRAVSLFETIEAIIWKPKISSIVPIVRIASKHF